YPVFDGDGNRLPNVGRSTLGTYWNANRHEILEGSMVAKPDQLAGRSKAWLHWSWVGVQLPPEDAGWTLLDCFLNQDKAIFSYRKGSIPSLNQSIFTGPVTLKDFSQANLSVIEGARFEAGLSLSQGQF